MVRRIRTGKVHTFGAKFTIVSSIVAISMLLALPALASASDRLIIGFDSRASLAAEVDSLQDAGVASATKSSVAKNDLPAIDAAVVTVAEGAGPAIAAKLRRDGDVDFVEVDRVAHAFWTPNDDYFASQWALSNVGATTAWNTALGTGATIAVVDTGVEYTHPDLSGRVDLGYDYVSGDTNPADVQGHGTHVAGIAAGIANNSEGIAGLAPDARILAVRVLDGDGSGYYSWIANGIIYAADQGADVINLSLGGSDPSEILREAVDYATTKGSMVTCAAGNDGQAAISYPARYANCVAVAASNQGNSLADFSNFGVGVDITAPGVDILSSVRGGGYESWSGTSMATPYVSGLAALLASQGLNRAQILATMQQTASDLGPAGFDTYYGYGLINAADAVASASVSGGPADDDEAPVVTGESVGAKYTVSTTKVSYVWKKVKTSRWRYVGRSDYDGSYSWTNSKTKGAWRYVTQFKLSRGVIKKRVVTSRRRKKYTTVNTAYRNINVTATDNIGVDRTGLSVDGHWVGTDWSAGDGLSVAWKCSPGTHTFTVYTFDAQDNVDNNQLSQTVTC